MSQPQLDSQDKPFSQEVIDRLKKRGEEDACFGSLMLASDIHSSIHTLHLVRNQLVKDAGYENRVMFLNGSIKILEKELIRSLEYARQHWSTSR